MVLAGLEAFTAMRRIPFIGSFLLGSFLLSGALGLACAGNQTAKGSPCLDRCANIQSSLDRSTCELDCQRLANGTANPPPDALPPAATPAPTNNGRYTPPPADSPTIVGTPTPRSYPATQPIVQPPAPKPNPASGPAVVTPVVTPSRPQRRRAAAAARLLRDRLRQRARRQRPLHLPPAVRADHQPPHRPRTTGTAPTSGPARPVAVDPQVLSACLNTCNSGPETDRATCRLQCNANGSVGPAPSSYYLHGGTPPSDADQRAAAIRSSQGVAGTTTPAPASTPANQQKIAACAAAAQQCSTTCDAQRSPCTAECDTGKLSSTDRATCKLTCDSTVDGCRDDCRIKEGSCRSK
jgi:hypothetical protein